jgi:hypothetical protein
VRTGRPRSGKSFKADSVSVLPFPPPLSAFHFPPPLSTFHFPPPLSTFHFPLSTSRSPLTATTSHFPHPRFAFTGNYDRIIFLYLRTIYLKKRN